MNEGLVRGRGEERREGRGGRWNELIEFKKVIKKREREKEIERVTKVERKKPRVNKRKYR